LQATKSHQKHSYLTADPLKIKRLRELNQGNLFSMPSHRACRIRLIVIIVINERFCFVVFY
jgi:hypothetical protein